MRTAIQRFNKIFSKPRWSELNVDSTYICTYLCKSCYVCYLPYLPSPIPTPIPTPPNPSAGGGCLGGGGGGGRGVGWVGGREVGEIADVARLA